MSVPDHDQHSPVHRWEERFSPPSYGNGFRRPEGSRLSTCWHAAAVDGCSGSDPRTAGVLMEGAELRQRLGLKSTLVSFEMVSGRS